jgi:predicted DCC family thiol-disulfide oxidoreductase YuxK
VPEEIVFYDGNCGLCHGAVRFFLHRDRTGLRFAPLHGETFARLISPDIARGLPDSLVFFTADGELYTRSRAVLHLLQRLSLPYRVLAGVGSWIPTRILDSLYDGVAAIRARLFAKPEGTCPLLPPHLASRIDP